VWWCGLDYFRCTIQWTRVCVPNWNLPLCMWIGAWYSMLRPGTFILWIKWVYSRQRSDLPPQTPLPEFLFSTCYKLNQGWSCIWPPIHYAADGSCVNLLTQTQSTQSLCVRVIYHSDSFMIPYKVAIRRSSASSTSEIKKRKVITLSVKLDLIWNCEVVKLLEPSTMNQSVVNQLWGQFYRTKLTKATY
jgi:hypothetical protein